MKWGGLVPVCSPHHTPLCGTTCSELAISEIQHINYHNSRRFLERKIACVFFQCRAVFPALGKKCCVPLLSLEQPRTGTGRKWSAVLVLLQLSIAPTEHIWASSWQGRGKRKPILTSKLFTLTCNTSSRFHYTRSNRTLQLWTFPAPADWQPVLLGCSLEQRVLNTWIQTNIFQVFVNYNLLFIMALPNLLKSNLLRTTAPLYCVPISVFTV